MCEKVAVSADRVAGYVDGFRCAVRWVREWLEHGGDPRDIGAKFASVSDEVLRQHAERARER